MNKYKQLGIVLLALTVLAIGSIILMGSGDGKAYLPGITTADEHPNGCVDCHVQTGDNDYRLNTELAASDKHPDVSAIIRTVPTDCLMCHKEGAPAGALSVLVHKNHYENPEENHFIAYYQGECLQCHTLEANGVMRVKSGPKNW